MYEPTPENPTPIKPNTPRDALYGQVAQKLSAPPLEKRDQVYGQPVAPPAPPPVSASAGTIDFAVPPVSSALDQQSQQTSNNPISPMSNQPPIMSEIFKGKNAGMVTPMSVSGMQADPTQQGAIAGSPLQRTSSRMVS